MNISKVSDWLSNKTVWNSYCELKESQWYSRDDLNSIKLRKFKRLIEHCYQNVPYYQKHMRSIGMIPSDINDIVQIEEFPIITKETIKENYLDFTPNNLQHIRGVKTSQTGGTTGNILIKRNDANTRSSIWGAFKRFEDWMGFETRDAALILMGGHVLKHRNIDSIKSKMRSNIINLLYNRVALNPYDTSTENTNRVISTLINFNFQLIRSYSQYLFFVCNTMKARNIKVSVPTVTTTAEPLMQIHRDVFKDVLGAESFDQYGCGEIGGIAFECDKHEGLHISEERLIVEIQANHDLVVTDLDNYAMPFIRYWNADQAVASTVKCSCGREHTLIEKILGRTCDYVTGVNGEFLHWAYFWHLVFDSGIAGKRNLLKFQVVQKSTNNIEFHYIADELSLQEKISISDNMKDRLGDMNIEFIQEKCIENSPSGKYRPVINEMLR